MNTGDIVNHKLFKGKYFIRLKKKNSNQCLISNYPFSGNYIKCTTNDLILIKDLK